MKRHINEVVKSIDGTDYVEIGAKGYKDAGRDASDW